MQMKAIFVLPNLVKKNEPERLPIALDINAHVCKSY